jgi:hypothetical protein
MERNEARTGEEKKLNKRRGGGKGWRRSRTKSRRKPNGQGDEWWDTRIMDWLSL